MRTWQFALADQSSFDHGRRYLRNYTGTASCATTKRGEGGVGWGSEDFLGEQRT